MNTNDLAINDKNQDSYLKREQDKLINDEGLITEVIFVKAR